MNLGDDYLQLLCVIEGETEVFPIDIKGPSWRNPKFMVGDLKEKIQKKRKDGPLAGVDAHTLVLWKPKDTNPIDVNLDDLASIRSDEQLAEKLSSARPLGYIFPNQPPLDRLHIIIIRKPDTDDDQRPAKRLRSSDQVDEENPMAGGKTFKHTPSKPLAQVRNTVQQILERYRPTMQKLVADAGTTPLIPSWIPKIGSGRPKEMAFREHIKTLAIPTVQGLPSLLLHDLCIEAGVADDKESKHTADIFSLDNHTVLINTSGSGKTRLGLRGLCQNWGFYAVVRRGPDGIGSDDFWGLMDKLDNSLHYNQAKSIGFHDDAAARHMQQKVHRCILQFLLARFYLLNLLIDEASKCKRKLHPVNHRLLWVLLQTRPTEMIGDDAFKEVAEALRIASIEDLEQQIKAEYSRLEHILEFVDHPATGQPKRRPLYCFLDEIQITTVSRMGEFRSDDGKTKRPLLRPIWSSMTGILDSTKMLLIVSGTGIDWKSIQDILDSSVFKFCPYALKRDIGAFDDPDAQRQYIEHYIPGEQSAAWDAFLERAWGWCRGRYRSTATLIVLILMAGQYSPHKTLDAFVKRSTNFSPTDGQKWCADEPELDDLGMEKMKAWNFERLNSQQIMTLCDALYDQKIYGYYSLKPFAPEDDIKVFIEYGFARTKSRSHVIDEPLAIMAAWDWLDKMGHFSLFNCLQRDIGRHTPRKNGFEAYLAFYVRKVFEKAPRLDDVFTFRSDFARRKRTDLCWQTENFELVAVSISAHTNERKISVITPSCGPSSNVGFLAPTDEEVLNWISENKEHYAFCFPTESTGPDIFFYIRSMMTQRLLLVAIQAKQYKVVEKSSLVQGVCTVTPSWFWKSKDTKYQSPDEIQSSSSDIAARFCDALLKIDSSITIMDASYPILRVFASWPANAQLDRTLDYKMSPKKKNTKPQAQVKVDEDSVGTHDPDLHPLATLHLENFNKIGEALGESWYKGDTEQREVVFAKRQCNDKDQLRRSERIQARLNEMLARQRSGSP